MLQDALGELAQLTDTALKDLPETVQLPSHRPWSLYRYHVVNQQGDHMCVIQLSRPLLGGVIDAVKVDGIVLEGDGTRRALRDDETWEFW
jgi:hypothetical protein